MIDLILSQTNVAKNNATHINMIRLIKTVQKSPWSLEPELEEKVSKLVSECYRYLTIHMTPLCLLYILQLYTTRQSRACTYIIKRKY